MRLLRKNASDPLWFTQEILVPPAWPNHWNVFFKLHANAKTTIIGGYRDGRMELNVSPAARRKDVKIMIEQTPIEKP